MSASHARKISNPYKKRRYAALTADVTAAPRSGSLDQFFLEQRRRILGRLRGVKDRLKQEYLRCGLNQVEVASCGISGHQGKRAPSLAIYDQRKDLATDHRGPAPIYVTSRKTSRSIS